jgi:TP901 family phage tail tape measure protein
MAELNALNATAGNLEKRLQGLSVARLAGGTLIRDLQSVAAPKFQWDEGLRQTDMFVKNLHRGKIEIQGITDFMEKWKNQSRDIAENQTRLANAVTRTGSGGQTQAYLPSVTDIRNSTMALEAQNRQFSIQNEMLKVASTQIQNWGKNMQWAGRQLMVGFTIPFAAAAAAAGVFAFTVDKEITRIAKVYDGAKEEVKGLALSTASFVTQTMGATAKSTLDVMAQLAAVGQKGEELRQGAIQVQRLATLGEMDSETSLKSYIAMQAVFKMSVEETADAINYMNSVENATSLQMEDFAEAIPRAAAPVKQLGGSIQDLGTIMVALKERGVDAAEGANAIKTLMNRLINPAEQTKETFKALTGKDLPEFIKSTKGELMPTMKGLADVIMNGNLSLLEQQQLIGRLGGAYQLTRLTAILDGLATKGGQVEKAFEVAAQGESKWAASAAQELETQTSSISKKFTIAVESFKMQLQGFGEVALKMATFVIEKVGGIMTALNAMPEWAKGMLIFGASVLAIAGPIAMLVGIFANFVGTIGRGMAGLLNLNSKYKSLTIEQKAAAIAAGDLKTKFMSEADSVQILVFQLEKLQRAYLETTQASAMASSAAAKASQTQTIMRSSDKALEREKAEAQKLAIMMNQHQDFIEKNRGVPSSKELGYAEQKAYLEQARRDILANPRYTDQKRGLIFDPEMRNKYEELGKQQATAHSLYLSEQKKRYLEYKAEDDKLRQEIRTQESALTSAIKHRSDVTRQAMDAEKQMLMTGLKEQAAHAAALVSSSKGQFTNPSEVMLGNTRYLQSNNIWRKEENGSGRFVKATKDEVDALNKGFSEVAATTGQVANNIQKSSFMAKAFSQEALFAVSAFAAIGSSIAGTNSGLASWLNYLALGAGLLSIIAPFFGQIADFVKNRDFVQSMFGGPDGGKGKIAKFGSNVMEKVSSLGKAAASLFFNPWTLGIAAVGVAAFAVYKMVTAESNKNVEHMQAIASTTDGWMKTLGQAEVKWGQIKDSSGQVKDDMQAMVQKVRQDNAELVTEVSRRSGSWLDDLLRSQVYRLQGQGLSQADIMKSMETLLMAAGKTRADIDKILGNIRVTFDFKTPISDLDVFLKDARDKMYAAGIFRGDFQGKEGFFEQGFNPTRQGSARLDQFASDIMGKMVGLDDTMQKAVAEKLAQQLSSAMEQGFRDLKDKYGDKLKNTWQESAQDLLEFTPDSGYFPKQRTTPSGGQAPITPVQRDLALQLNANRDLALKLAKAMNIPDDVAKKFRTFNDILPMIGNSTKSATEVQKQYNDAVEKAEKVGGKLTDEQKKQMAAAYASARGLDAAKLAANGYAAAIDKSSDAIKENNKGIELLLNNLRDVQSQHGDFSGILSGSGSFWQNTADSESGFGGLSGSPEQQGSMLNDAMRTAYGNSMNVAFDLASMQAERQYQARMDGITNYYQGIKDRLQNESKQLDNAWQDRMQAFDDSWRDRVDATKQSFEDRRNAIQSEIDAIEDQRDANKELDDQRQRMFEAEERRAERLAELANSNIKYTRALASGNLDEAAMIMNNTERLQSAWGSQDSKLASEENSRQRDKADQQRIDALKKKQDALKNEEDAVMKSLEKQQEMEKRALEQQKENERERLQNRIDSLAKEQSAVEQSERRKQELDRKTLEIQLATLKAFVPMNEAQLWEHIGRVQGAYGQHGIQLQFKGTQWGQIVGSALFNNVEAARVQLSNNSAWQQSGAAIGDAISKGAFGLSLGDFFNMIITGQPPAGWKPPGSSASYIPQQFSTGGPNKFYHTGGLLGFDPGGRNGMGGQLNSDEIPIVAQRGEFMMSKAATDRLGPQTLRDLNSGKIGMGGSDLGFAAIGAGVGVALMRAMLNAVFLGSQKQQQEGSVMGMAEPGIYGNVKLDAEQLKNAQIIASVGKSMGASTRDIVISFMTAMQESGLRNLNYGDRDSLGLFQQRPSMGWGTPAQVTNPEYAARKFFEGLLRVENRGSMPLTLAAQAVQRSGFPYAYANWQSMAEALVGKMGSDPNQLAGFGMFSRMLSERLGGAGAGTGKYVRPTSGPVTSEYGMRWGKLHDGIDIGAPTGTQIVATDSGRVISAGFNNGGFGYWTLIDHGSGLISGYAHQSRLAVAGGQAVNRGQVIGYVGNTGYSTGPHLHFQMGGGPGQFQNPRNWIPSLDVGGTVNYDNVLANLHKDETVLTSPLSAALERGINQLDSGVSNAYYVDVKIDGTNIPAPQLKSMISDIFEEKKLKDLRKVGKVR